MTEPPPPPGQPPPPQPPPPPGQPPQQPPPGSQPPGWTPPVAGAPGYGTGAQTDGLAIGALVTAIAGIFVCGVFPVHSVVALVLASNSNRKIRASGGRLTGEGLNRAATIVSWIWIGLSVLFWVVIIAIAASGGFDTDDEDEFDFESLGVGLQYLAARFGA